MRLPFCLRQTRWGAGPGPMVVDREIVSCDMMDERQIGRVPDFSERKKKDVITQRRDQRGYGRGLAWVCHASATWTGSSLNTRHLRHRMRRSVRRSSQG